MNLWQKIQNLPREQRKLILWATMVILTLFLLFLNFRWLKRSLPVREREGTMASSLQSFKQTFGEQAKKMGESLSGLKESFDRLAQAVELLNENLTDPQKIDSLIEQLEELKNSEEIKKNPGELKQIEDSIRFLREFKNSQSKK